jgi:hypothetical protein
MLFLFEGTFTSLCLLKAVLRIRIRWIRMFLGLLDPVSDPLVRGMDEGTGELKEKPTYRVWCLYSSFVHVIIVVRKTLIPTVL